VHDLEKTPLKRSRDVFMHEESSCLGFDNIVLPNSLYQSHVSPVCSLPSLSPEYYIVEPIGNPMIYDTNIDLGCEDNLFSMLGGNVDNCVSLGYFRGYDPSINPYCICLGNLPKKIMWTTFFNPSYNFSMVFAEAKRIVILFGVILVIVSYLLFSKLWSWEFDKLLWGLTMSNLMSEVLKL